MSQENIKTLPKTFQEAYNIARNLFMARRTTKQKLNTYLYNHIWLKYVIDYGVTFIMSVLSAAIFIFGVNCFLDPAALGGPMEGSVTLVSGGSSGVAQVFLLILETAGVDIANRSLVFSIGYLVVNIPLIILAFVGIGKRFAIFTLINVASAFLFSNIFHGELFVHVAYYVSSFGGLLPRALFAGICTGISSAVAYKWETSAGGFDIVSYYFSLRKSNGAGKYGVMINAIIVSLFTLFTAIKGGAPLVINGIVLQPWAVAIGGMWFTLVYLLTVMLVIDVINVRNKKVQLQIITSNKDLPSFLLASVPHGATIVKATGAFSGEERMMIYMVVSSLEMKSTLKTIHEIDPHSFINVTPLYQVYGHFYSRPIR